VTVKNRYEFVAFMESRDIQVRVCFAGNVTRHEPYRKYLEFFPVADHLMEHGVLLGAHHGMSLDDVDRVCDAMLVFLSVREV